MESQVFSILVLFAFILLVSVSGGIAYLTLAEWRDRRRLDQANRADKSSRRSTGKTR